MSCTLKVGFTTRLNRRVSLTESGELYFQQVRLMLDTLDEVEAAVSNVTVIPLGTLRFPRLQ